MNMVNDDLCAWHVFGKSVRGASHTHKGLPNQDAICWKGDDDSGLPLVLAISDGHGSAKYFRSDRGASLAVALAVEELTQFAEAFAGPVTNIPLFTYLVEQLPKKIVEKWQARVRDHLAASRFFSEEEWQRYGNGSSLPELPRDPLISYGATLLTVLVTKTFILYLQLGDGDIIQVTESAGINKPMKGDSRLLANETTSLCSPSAVQDFRIHYEHFVGEPPALILLSTDGYANSFSDETGFLRVGSDILEMVRSKGWDWVKNSLPGWLDTATQQGSGDDITLGILYHITTALAQSSETEVPPVNAAVKQEHEGVVVADKPDSAVVTAAETAEKELVSPAPRVLVVSPQPDKGMYTSIQAALQDASAHTRIEVHPGVYQEHLLIDKDIELVGVDEHGVVTITGAAPCLTIQAPHAQLHNLKIQEKPSLLSALQPARAVVEITAGCSLLDHCEITGGNIGLRIRGAMTAPTVQACNIHHSRTGLLFSENALGLIVESRIAENKLHNVAISDGSNPIMQRCTIQDGQGVGIRISGGAAGRIEGCEIIDNQGVGLLIVQESNPTIMGCPQIARNQGGGLLFAARGGGKVIECDIAANKFSNILIQGLCHPCIQHCRLQNGEGQGILIDGQGQGGGGFIEDCDISGHKAEAILIRNASHPFIRLCTIHDGAGTGLLLQHKGNATLEKCTIVANSQCCVEVSGKGSRLSMSEVEIQQQQSSELAAIVFSDASTGQLERCKISTASSMGVAISQSVDLYLRLCLIESGSYALWAQQFSVARVEGGSYRSLTYGKKSAATSCETGSRIVYVQEDLVLS